MKNIIIVAGARPNFIKIAPIIHEIIKNKNKISYRLVHTGQHYDKNMSDSFFDQLAIPKPDINLKCKGKTHAEQTSSIMLSFEEFLLKNTTDLVLVVGDVTSTMACAIVSQKLKIKVAHVEAGIRSGDWSMPEEINRMVTDSITNYFFTTSDYANNNLLNSGIEKDRIFFVGNTMIDTLFNQRSNFKKPNFWDKVKLKNKKYLVITLHRPGNVDEELLLKNIINKVIENSKDLKIIFPLHPRTAKSFNKLNIVNKRLFIVDPLSYLEFNYLVQYAKVVITDSGGITEETTVMSIPCMTLRDNTERPETIKIGTNELIGTNPDNLTVAFEKLFKNKWKKGQIPKYWDGKTSQRIVKKLIEIL